jgi:hypothetical protein
MNVDALNDRLPPRYEATARQVDGTTYAYEVRTPHSDWLGPFSDPQAALDKAWTLDDDGRQADLFDQQSSLFE